MKTNARLAKRLREDYIENGIASFPCNVSGIDDIISHYSVKGFETLNPEFADYIREAADYIPADYPIVLEISGCAFSKEEQQMIKESVEDYFMYELGAVQQDNRRQLYVAIVMTAAMLFVGSLVYGKVIKSETISEILYIFFWFFADMFCCFVFLDRFRNKANRIHAARLARIQLFFSEEYDDSDMTDDDAELVYKELES